jgi:hypothetical protein
MASETLSGSPVINRIVLIPLLFLLASIPALAQTTNTTWTRTAFEDGVNYGPSVLVGVVSFTDLQGLSAEATFGI